MAAPALSAADQTFLASLAAPVPALAAKNPVAGKSTCTASASCGTSGTISCSGTTSCSDADQNCAVNQRGFVTCGTATTQCPNACDCTAANDMCLQKCGSCPIKAFQCSPYQCRCDFINCTNP
jgi:hypothetical protein